MDDFDILSFKLNQVKHNMVILIITGFLLLTVSLSLLVVQCQKEDEVREINNQADYDKYCNECYEDLGDDQYQNCKEYWYQNIYEDWSHATD